MTVKQDAQLELDHTLLLRRLSELYGTLCWESSQATSLRALSAELQDHLLEHFQREECAMREAGFPGLEAHQRAHAALRKRFLRRLEEGAGPSRTLLISLREQLLAHLVTWDEAFSEWGAPDPRPSTQKEEL